MSQRQDFEEYMFPNWGELVDEAIHLLNFEIEDKQIVDDILTVMALDNECEDVLTYASDHCSDAYIEYLIERGTYHPQHHTRWQIAELIARRNPKNGKNALLQLKDDANAYVRKRASNTLEELSNISFDSES